MPRPAIPAASPLIISDEVEPPVTPGPSTPKIQKADGATYQKAPSGKTYKTTSSKGKLILKAER